MRSAYILNTYLHLTTYTIFSTHKNQTSTLFIVLFLFFSPILLQHFASLIFY